MPYSPPSSSRRPKGVSSRVSGSSRVSTQSPRAQSNPNSGRRQSSTQSTPRASTIVPLPTAQEDPIMVARRRRLAAMRRTFTPRGSEANEAVKSPEPSGVPDRIVVSPHGQMGNTTGISASGVPNVSTIATDQLDVLVTENGKLRRIQQEFWALLKERDEMQQEIKKLKKMLMGADETNKTRADLYLSCTQRSVEDILQDVSVNKESINGTKVGQTPHTDAALVRRLQRELEAVQCALQDCMDVMITEEAQKSNAELPLQLGNVKKDGPVNVFIRWLNAGAPVAEPEIRHVSDSAITIRTRNVDLEEELQRTRVELREVQAELERTDLSRQQALEDAKYIRQQMEALKENLSEVKLAVIAAREAPANEIKDLRVQLAHRDAEIHQLKATVTRLNRHNIAETASLAADAARIRLDVARRSTSRER